MLMPAHQPPAAAKPNPKTLNPNGPTHLQDWNILLHKLRHSSCLRPTPTSGLQGRQASSVRYSMHCLGKFSSTMTGSTVRWIVSAWLALQQLHA